MFEIVKFDGGLIISSVYSRSYGILTSQLTNNGPKWKIFRDFGHLYLLVLVGSSDLYIKLVAFGF